MVSFLAAKCVQNVTRCKQQQAITHGGTRVTSSTAMTACLIVMSTCWSYKIMCCICLYQHYWYKVKNMAERQWKHDRNY